MEQYIIQGGRTLEGRLTVHGAKNSILPILAASLLNRSGEPIRLKKVPHLFDVRAMLAILSHLGVQVASDGEDVILLTAGAGRYHVPKNLMREMRSSIFLMGPLLGRLGKARLCYPGGCAIGNRPINLHLEGLQALGAIIEEKNGYINARGMLRGAEIALSSPSVGATENLILAGVLARGNTVIHNAAREPEIVDLQNFLNILGACVSGAGGRTVTVKGVREVGGGQYQVYPDRITAGTYIIAAALTGGTVILEEVIPEHLEALIRVLQQAGVEFEVGENWISARGGLLKAVRRIEIEPYPGFPTDLQPPLVALLALARGKSTVVENVFQERFRHTAELNKMGARISVQGNQAAIQGVNRLKGAAVEATDLRAGAALVLAGLAARGETVVTGVRHIERGYENLHQVLNSIGARVEPVGQTPALEEWI